MILSSILTSRARAFLVVGGVGLALSQACVSNEPADEGDGDGDTTGSGGNDSTTGSGGNDSTTGSGGNESPDDACSNGEAYNAHVPEQLTEMCETASLPNCNITDFEEASYDAASGAWGDDMSLTGETFEYDDGQEGTVASHTVESGAMTVANTLNGDGYAGVGLSFGPCVDATDFEGIQITVGGTLAEGGVFDLQLQTDENYPEGVQDDLGTCVPVDTESPWDSCVNNAFRIQGFTPESTLTYYIPWAEFVGGTPNDLDPRQLRGLQMQFGCDVDKAPCESNVQISDVRFYRTHDAYLGPDLPEGGASGE